MIAISRAGVVCDIPEAAQCLEIVASSIEGSTMDHRRLVAGEPIDDLVSPEVASLLDEQK